MKKPTIDLVVPCFNEEEGLLHFYEETRKVINTLPSYSFRFLFVDDGSRDNTANIMKTLATEKDDVAYIRFSRNFGKESAMYAGLSASTGDYVVVMDADLQHPPSLFPAFLDGLSEGYDCVAAMRSTRTGEGKFKSFLSSRFYSFSNSLTETKMPEGAVDYRIMSRRMVNAVLAMSEVQRFSKGLFMWVGFDTKWIPYENVERTAGTSKWSIKGLARYALDGITSFSTKPLQSVSIMGFLISVFAFIYIVITLIKTLITGIDVPGYVTTLCAVLFLGGIVEFSIGILGEYIARIFIEVKHRPIYIARETSLTALQEDNEDYD